MHEFMRKNMELAINDYDMIQEGDHILIGVSGGADSFALLKLLSSRKIYVTNDISILAVHLDLGFNPDNRNEIEQLKCYFESNQYEYHIEKTDIGQLAHSDFNRKNPCFLCSRLRRKRIVELANEFGCNKIAYGHHKDDIVETVLLSMFYGREISTMMPNQQLFKGQFHIIRPLAYLWENKVKKYAEQQQLPIFDTNCPTDKTSKRKVIKELLRQLQHDNKAVKENIFKSLKNIKTDYMLDERLWSD